MAAQQEQLGALLVRDNAVTQGQINHALQVQKEQEERQRVGEILADLGHLTRRQLRDAIRRYGKRSLLGEVLKESGVLTAAQLDEALALQSTTGTPLGTILIDQEIIDDEQLAQALSRQLDIPYVVPHPSLVDMDVFCRLPERFIAANLVIPMFDTDGTVTVVASDPTDHDLILKLEDALGADLDLATCGRSRIAASVESLLLQRRLGGRHRGDVDQAADGGAHARVIIEGERIGDQQDTSQAASAFDYLVHTALKERASDIHVEPESNRLRVRFRIDGVLVYRTDMPLSLAGSLARRAKAIAGLDIAETQRQQEGRISARVAGQEVDLRLAVCRTVFGEAMSIRIFSKATGLMDLDDLGMMPAQLSLYRRLIQESPRVVIIGGPTGVGKTTSLYATLGELNDGSSKIITVEAPVEYPIPGLVQHDIPGASGAEQAEALMAVLHHDPDLVALGEIDSEEAALSLLTCAQMGHRAMATMHAEDAVGVFARLSQMPGMAPVLSSCPLVVVSQRLVRKVCASCAEPDIADIGAIRRFRVGDFDPDAADFVRGSGCADCLGSGFRGRTGVFEVLAVGPELRERLAAAGTGADVRRAVAGDAELLTMRHVGLLKAIQGVTTLEEVLRAVPGDQGEGAAPSSLGGICRRAGVNLGFVSREEAADVD